MAVSVPGLGLAMTMSLKIEEIVGQASRQTGRPGEGWSPPDHDRIMSVLADLYVWGDGGGNWQGMMKALFIYSGANSMILLELNALLALVRIE